MATKTKPKTKKPATRKPNPFFMRPLVPSEALAAIVGADPMPRAEITSKLWMYIKKHQLQDATNRRMINADAKLKPFFGGKKQVSMFEMTSFVSAHTTG